MTKSDRYALEFGEDNDGEGEGMIGDYTHQPQLGGGAVGPQDPDPGWRVDEEAVRSAPPSPREDLHMAEDDEIGIGSESDEGSISF